MLTQIMEMRKENIRGLFEDIVKMREEEGSFVEMVGLLLKDKESNTKQVFKMMEGFLNEENSFDEIFSFYEPIIKKYVKSLMYTNSGSAVRTNAIVNYDNVLSHAYEILWNAFEGGLFGKGKPEDYIGYIRNSIKNKYKDLLDKLHTKKREGDNPYLNVALDAPTDEDGKTMLDQLKDKSKDFTDILPYVNDKFLAKELKARISDPVYQQVIDFIFLPSDNLMTKLFSKDNPGKDKKLSKIMMAKALDVSGLPIDLPTDTGDDDQDKQNIRDNELNLKKRNSIVQQAYKAVVVTAEDLLKDDELSSKIIDLKQE